MDELQVIKICNRCSQQRTAVGNCPICSCPEYHLDAIETTPDRQAKAAAGDRQVHSSEPKEIIMHNHTKDELSDYNDELRERRSSICMRQAELDVAKEQVSEIRKALENETGGLMRHIGEFNEDLPLLDGVQEDG